MDKTRLEELARLEWNRYMREYRARNKEKINEYQRRWYAKNKEKVKEYNRRRYLAKNPPQNGEGIG